MVRELDCGGGLACSNRAQPPDDLAFAPRPRVPPGMDWEITFGGKAIAASEPGSSFFLAVTIFTAWPW